MAPVLVHMAKDSSGKFPFNPVSVNLLVELAKTLFALATLVIYVSGEQAPAWLSAAERSSYHAVHSLPCLD